MQADLILKEFWDDNDRFADFFNTVYFDGRKVVMPEELESVPETLYYAEKRGKKLETVEKHRDKVKLWHGTVLVLLSMEHQQKVHYAMPERVMLYDALQYEKQRKEIKSRHGKKKDLGDDEFVSGYAKTDKMSPVLTVVIYYGEKPWDGPTSLREMVEMPRELEPYFVDYPIHLFQVLGNDGRDFENEDLRTVFRNADALRSKRRTDECFSAEMAKYLAAFVNSERVLRLSEKKGEVRMCTALEEMIQEGKEEGRAEGKAEGKAEGRAEAILDILRDRGFVPNGLERRILEEKNIDTLRGWLKRAIRVKTVEEFQLEML